MRTSATCSFPLLLAALLSGCASSEPATSEPRSEPTTVLDDCFDAYLPVDQGRSNEDPWLVLDLHTDRRVFVGEQCVFDGAKHTDEQLVERLAELRAAALAEGRCHLVDRETPFGERRVILEPVILRARSGVKYADIARINDCCGHPSLRFENVYFGDSAEPQQIGEAPSRDAAKTATHQSGLEDLILPGRAEVPHDPPWLVLEVHRDGRVFVDGRCEFVNESGTDEELEALLARYRAAALAEGRCHLESKDTPDGGVEVVTEAILIRAQKGTEWAAVDRIMKRCAQPSLAIWKIRLAMTEGG